MLCFADHKHRRLNFFWCRLSDAWTAALLLLGDEKSPVISLSSPPLIPSLPAPAPLSHASSLTYTVWCFFQYTQQFYVNRIYFLSHMNALLVYLVYLKTLIERCCLKNTHILCFERPVLAWIRPSPALCGSFSVTSPPSPSNRKWPPQAPSHEHSRVASVAMYTCEPVCFVERRG